MTEIPFVWNRPACSLKSLVDGNTFPCVIKIAERFCSTLEELESGEILILHGVRQRQFAVVVHPSRGELLIPFLLPFKVHLVPLDRLHEEYNTVEELFIAQPDYFRVLDAIPSLNIEPGTVMKICARQNGVYHLECEAVGDAVCHQIVNLPLNQRSRFQPLSDAGEYLLEEAITSYPPPSDVGVRLINSSSTGSGMSTATDVHLPWDSGLRVLGVFHDETVIATTTVGEEPNEVLLLPKTLDVSVVPACESSVLYKQLTTAVRTPMLDPLVEQVMKFSSLRAYNWSCRVCRFSFQELMNHPACDFQEPESGRTAINPGKAAQDSRDATTTTGQPGQTPRTTAIDRPMVNLGAMQRVHSGKAQ